MLFFVPMAFGQVSFDQLQALKGDKALFTAQTPSPGNGNYKTLFFADLASRQMEQLTFFPEQVFYLSQTGQIQFHNRFGVFRSDSTLSQISRVKDFPSFVEGDGLSSGKILPLQASSDGRYIVYLTKKDPVTADLNLFEVSTGTVTKVSENLQLSLDDLPARWSPDGQFFVYQKNLGIYYYSIQQMKEKRVPAEGYRRLGAGTLSSIAWSPRSELFMISGRLVYRLLTGEFFTRALYGGQFRTGTLLGKIPEEFDPEFDRFWISPEGTRILISRSGRKVYLYDLGKDDYFDVSQAPSLPYLILPRGSVTRSVLWNYDNQVLILVGTLFKGGDQVVYRLNQKGAPRFELAEEDFVRDFYLSPDQENVLVLKKDKAEVKDIRTWQTQNTLTVDNPLWGYWLDDQEILLSGHEKTESWSLGSDNTALVCFSQPGEIAVSADFDLPVMKASGQGWLWSPVKRIWESRETLNPRVSTMISDKYRVYLKMVSGYSYENVVMMRNLSGVETYPLFELPRQQFEPFPEVDEPVNFTRFHHGSRIRRREVALVFNARDNAEGISTVLQVLDSYDLKSTFFVNGDFIRQNPGATRDIADSGHEVGNLFYVNYEMANPRYKLDKDFLKQGLARNEDDFYGATGKELALLWHSPDYFYNKIIEEVTQELNYLYIDRDLDPLDWISLEDTGRYGSPYLSNREIIRRILEEKKPGSIIPVQLGKIKGRREEYLFHDLDLLIDGLIEAGYDVVPVSVLLEHAR